MHSIFHGISGNDVWIVIMEIGIDTIWEKADVNVPLHKEMATLFVLPNPAHSHPLFTMPLLEVETFWLVRHGVCLFVLVDLPLV